MDYSYMQERMKERIQYVNLNIDFGDMLLCMLFVNVVGYLLDPPWF